MPCNSFLKRHRERFCDRIGNLVDRIRVHDQGFGKFFSRTCKTRQNQHSGVGFVLRGYVFLGDEVHSVTQGRDQSDLASAQQASKPRA